MMATKLESFSCDPVPESEESADSLAVCLTYLEREARKSGYSLTAHIVGVARESLKTECQNAMTRNGGTSDHARLKVS